MTWIPENAPYPVCPQWGYFHGEYRYPSYDDKLREAADAIASAVYHSPKGSTITVEKHKDGGVGLKPIVTLTVKSVIE